MPLQNLTESVERLDSRAGELARELAATRVELRRQIAVTRIAIAVGIVVVLCVVVAAFQVSLDNSRAIEENNQRWCPTLTSFIPRAGEPAPTPGRGAIVLTRLTDLARDYGCIKEKK